MTINTTHQLAEPVYPARVPRLVSVITIILWTALPLTLHAQSPAQLDRLIFDPVLLEAGTGKELPGPALTVPQQLLPLDYDDPLNAVNSTLSASTDGASESISRYRELVEQQLGADGPFSAELYQSLLDLGTQYQLQNEHQQAIEIFERAEYLSRINNGLYNPEQFRSIEKMIESYLALGDVINANRKQSYLVYLNNQYYGLAEVSTVPSLVKLADQHMENFRTVLAAPRQPSVSFNFSTATDGSFSRPSQRQMAFGSLYMAQQNYSSAISTLMTNEQFFDPVLLDLEYRYLETIFLMAFRGPIIEDPDYYLSERRRITGSLISYSFNQRFSGWYYQGKNSFERLLIYIRSNPDALVYQLVNALMQYGDWHLMFRHGNSARKKYRKAMDVVSQLDMNQSQLDQLFRPAMPVHLPLLTPKPNSREKFGIAPDQALDYEGYLDVGFTISRYGRAKKINFLGGSDNATRAIRKRLTRYLSNSPFRPIINNEGDAVARDVTLRYYFAYNSADNFAEELSETSESD